MSRLSRGLVAGGRRQLTARLSQLRGGPAGAGFDTTSSQGVPVTARVEPGLRLSTHQAHVVGTVTQGLDAAHLSWWWVPQPDGRQPALGLHVRDRASVLAVVGELAGPAWYADSLDESGLRRQSWVRAGAPGGSPAGLLLWEFAVPAAGSSFLAGPDEALPIWFFADSPDGTDSTGRPDSTGRTGGIDSTGRTGPPGSPDGDAPADLVCLVRNGVVSRLPAAECTGSGGVPRPLAARPTAQVGFDIDVVYTWVDGDDDGWLLRKAEAAGVADPTRFTERAHDAARWADHDELRYSLRALEQFAPWVRHVWIVTDDQHPAWLLPDHPWVTVVSHRDIWPDGEGLPTFNSHAIETCLHRIPGLAENFVYLNDDMLFGRPVRPEQFFHPSGIGKFFWSNALVDHSPSVAGDIASSTAAKNARRLLQDRYGVTFSRKFFHTASTLTVSGLAALEAEFPEVVAKTRQAAFRTLDDVAMAGSFYLNWAYVTGRAVPSRLRYTYVNPALPEAARQLRMVTRTRAFEALCVNDGTTVETAEQRRSTDRLIRDFFADYLPVPGSFEVGG